MKFVKCVVLLSMAILLLHLVHAVPFQQKQIFHNPASGNGFGASVSAFGNTVLVGAPLDSSSGTNSGAVYLFDASTGALLHTFLSPTPSSGDEFGVSVATVGNEILIGAPLVNARDFNSGAAYLFDGFTGKLIRTILNPAPAPNAVFGASVAAMGADLLIGGSISVFLFDGDTGKLLQTFHNPDHPGGGVSQTSDGFGLSVAAVESDVLVGAPRTSIGAINSGAAYLFDSASAKLLQTFLNPAPVRDGSFGQALGSVGGSIIIGAPQDVTAGMATGRVFVFNSTTGALVRSIPDPHPDPSSFNSFGFSIAALGVNIIVGAPGDSTAAGNAGTVYILDSSTFGIVQTITDPAATRSDQFGQSLAVTGSALVIGAVRFPANSPGGAAYLFG
jgi:WD40 repeat protein